MSCKSIDVDRSLSAAPALPGDLPRLFMFMQATFSGTQLGFKPTTIARRGSRMLVAMIPMFSLLQGTAPRTDALTRLLHQQQLTGWMIAAGLGIAFVLGAAHALTPGHGKTIVAAYLVGSRGTLKHAAFLGAIVTFTHTVSVFLLGLATLFLFQYVVPQKVTQVLGAISGLSIVAIGGWMLYKRLQRSHSHSHDHVHSHAHAHEHHHHDHPHDHAHERTHAHEHGHSHGHSHGPGGHTHMPDEMSWSGLAALGVSGGLVPCESALVLLLTAIALRRVGLGLLLLISFSLGLALVLMAIGILVIYAKNLLPSSSGGNPFFRWMPVASAAVVMLLGVVMTGVSLGWIRPQWMAG
jgi:nickel/cobalt transporter (NicO) family protein